MAVFAWENFFPDRHPGLTREWAEEVKVLEHHKLKSKDVCQINADLERTKKALVILGCSFADGQASIPGEILADLTPVYHEYDNTYNYMTDSHSDSEIGDLAVKYKLPVILEKYHKKALTVDIYNTELHNGWGSQLGRLLNDEYTVINCADRGAGNLSAIQKMYRYPIAWESVEEIMVVWSVCDYTRWSLLHSNNYDRSTLTGDSKTFWWIPEKPISDNDQQRYLNWMMSEHFYKQSAMFFIDQYIDNCAQLRIFTKQFKKSNIVVVPAFSSLPENDTGMEWHYYLSTIAKSSASKELAKIIKSRLLTEYVWDVDGHENLGKFCIARETPEAHIDWHHFSNQIRAVGGEWVSPCCHPTHIAQTEIAQRLHKHIVTEVL